MAAGTLILTCDWRQVCRRPLVKDCNSPGEEICRTEYQSECWSKQIPHEVSTNKQKAAARVKYSNRTLFVKRIFQ